MPQVLRISYSNTNNNSIDVKVFSLGLRIATKEIGTQDLSHKSAYSYPLI